MLNKHSNLGINCNGTQISSKSSVKYLGVDLDQTLSGQIIANKVISKIGARLKYLFRQSTFLTTNSRKLLASALIQCHLDYACSWWYFGLTKKLKSQLQISQNKSIRFILGVGPRFHIGSDSFKLVNWLPVEQRVQQIILNHTFKINNGSAPDYLCRQFTHSRQVHNHQTRSSALNFNSIPVKTHGKSWFRYMAGSLWNSLPIQLKNITEIKDFKKQLRQHLFQIIVQNETNDVVFY